MDLNSNTAWVNRSDTLISVYSQLVNSEIHAGGVTAGGSQIGQIYANEFYTVIGQNDVTDSREINFRNSAGQWATGYIQTNSGWGAYAWVQYQEPFNRYCVTSSGTSLAKAGALGGYYQHGLRRNVTVLKPSGSYAMTLGPGVIIGASSSQCGKDYTTFMKCEKVSYDGGASWQDMTSEGPGFVSLQLEAGSMPSNRSVL